jgi:hypothetical protein
MQHNTESINVGIFKCKLMCFEYVLVIVDSNRYFPSILAFKSKNYMKSMRQFRRESMKLKQETIKSVKHKRIHKNIIHKMQTNKLLLWHVDQLTGNDREINI